MASLRHARQRLEELGYDPLQALVEIAGNRNQISDLRVKAAIALLPYAYSQAQEASVDDNAGVIVLPTTPGVAEWEKAYRECRAAQQRSLADDEGSSQMPTKAESERHVA